MSVHDRIEAAFARWAHFVAARPGTVILASLAASVVLAAGLGQLRIEASLGTFLPKDDPARVAYDAFRADFSHDAPTFVIVRAPDLFGAEALGQLRSLHAAIEDELPMVGGVDSLSNARVTRGDGDTLVVEQLLEGWPEGGRDPSAAWLEEIRARALASPLYPNLYVSPDASYAMLLITLRPDAGVPEEPELGGFEPAGDAAPPRFMPRVLSQAESDAIVEALEEIVERYRAPDFEIWTVGLMPTAYHTVRAFTEDMGAFAGLSLLLIGTVLALLFRRASAVALPLLAILFPVLATFGSAGWADIPVTPVSQTLPSFLLAVGVCDAIHLLTLFYRHLDAGRTQAEALEAALIHTGVALVMTSITTAGCLLSFVLADLEPLRGFGAMAAAGVMLALAFTLTLLPALLVALPIRRNPARAGARLAGDRLLIGAGRLATRHPGAVVVGWAVLLCVGLAGAAQLGFSQDKRNWFAPGTAVREADEVASRAFGAGETLELIVDTGRPAGLHEPAALRRLDRVHRHAEQASHGEVSVTKSISLVDVVKETHRALHSNDPAFYRIPATREAIAQELLLFENQAPDAVAKLTEPTFQRARTTLLLPTADATELAALRQQLEPELEAIVGDGMRVTITGVVELAIHTMFAALRSMATSYTLALLFLAPLLTVMIGSLRIGLLCMIPNVAPIVIVLGGMYWLDVPLDMFTMMIGSVAIGVAVDDTIHIMHTFRRAWSRSGNVAAAIEEALLTTGRALLVTSIVLVSGFLVFLRAQMVPIAQFGAVTGTAVALAFLADVLLAPALLTLALRGRGAPERS